VLGQTLDSPTDIARIAATVAYDSMDLLQAAHTFSGVEMAMWDLLGRVRQEPVWRLLGYTASHWKTPYASVLFGDTPPETLERARTARADGFRASKFGWGPIGRADARVDAEHFAAAREGLGPEGLLLVDVGQIFGDDVEAAAERLPALERADVLWLEEPRSRRAHSKPTGRLPAAALGFGSPAGKRRTTPAWPAISSITAASASFRSIVAASAESVRPRLSPTTLPGAA
jgi:L-alanine-DL-glutamate epimerase-like enolase superfamily enzyme